MKNDPVIDRIRNVRKQISAKYNHDPKKFVEHYIEQEKKQKKEKFYVQSVH